MSDYSLTHRQFLLGDLGEGGRRGPKVVPSGPTVRPGRKLDSLVSPLFLNPLQTLHETSRTSDVSPRAGGGRDGHRNRVDE